jgi:hypothetical protein
MTLIRLTDEQLLAIERSGQQPPTAIDPRTNTAYVLIRADVYEQARPLLDQTLSPPADEPAGRVAPIMRQSQQAFWRDLPELLKLKSRKHQWVAYHGNDRVTIGRTDVEVYQACLRRGLVRGEFYVASISERDTPPWAVEPIEESLHECSDEPLPSSTPPRA